MCRIAGILQPAMPIAEMQNTVQQMCDLQIHGGPDDGGIAAFDEANLVLGNRRLSLLDLTAGGHQPMHFQSRYTITYNGELYNYTSLREELKKEGIIFSNNTDTEVILAAFSQWQTDSFSRLSGMFAFALWDNQDQQLYLVRDPAGIKPLYWSGHTGGIAFASEIRAFSPVKYLQQTNTHASVYQLAYGYIPEPVTTLEHVKPVPKGCYIKFDAQSNSCSLFSFSFFSYSNNINDKEEAQRLIQNAAEFAVKRQLIADANVGVFLSGGLDSAIIANLADKATPGLHTLSIWFGEEKYSEKKYQDLIAEQLSGTHHSILLKETEFHQSFPAFLSALDMPSCDGINTWFISKYASAAGLKGVLSGIGADELFGGYPSFNRMQAAAGLQMLPAAAFNTVSSAQLKKWDRIMYLRMPGIRGLYLFLRGHFTPDKIAAQTGAYEKDVWSILESLPSPQLSAPASKRIAGWMEFNLYMQDQLLRDADVMSMAHGLEIRVPFLDDEMIKAANATDEKIIFGGSYQKQLLISSFKNSLPEEIWQRPKMGFSFPFEEWLKNSPYLEMLKQSSNKHTQKACSDFLAGRLPWSRIMSLIVLKHKKLI